MGATPRSGAPAPESPLPPLSAGASAAPSAAPSAIGPPHAGFRRRREGLPGRARVFPVVLGNAHARGAPSDAIVRGVDVRGRSLSGGGASGPAEGSTAELFAGPGNLQWLSRPAAVDAGGYSKNF